MTAQILHVSMDMFSRMKEAALDAEFRNSDGSVAAFLTAMPNEYPYFREVEVVADLPNFIHPYLE